MKMDDFARLPNSSNLAYVEELYAAYLRDPGSVPSEWRDYFESMGGEERDPSKLRLRPSFRPPGLFAPSGRPYGDGAGPGREVESASLQNRVDQLIEAYRMRGHMIARIDPLDRPRPRPRELDPEVYGFTESHMDRQFFCETLCSEGTLTLRQILERLRKTYCRSIGVEFMHIDDVSVRQWLRERMERTENRLSIEREEQIRILTKLTDAVIFEEFIQKKFLGAKTFSLEGAESLMPLLDLAIERAAEQGIDEIVLGMAHRGRLNVLANIIGKSPREIFREFEDKDPELHVGKGDVKYHLGYFSVWKAACGKEIHLALGFNPSHVEFVNPVALGRMRAGQDRSGDAERVRGLVLLIHGDAAFAGEGIVQETLNLSQIAAYTVGGTLHVVVNNQLGFTTTAEEGRSSAYATDVAKMLQIPIFHVNGEEPEAVAQVVRVAMDFRRTFKRDVVIDMYCYRRHGHNETDEPSFTQPVMYKAIAERPSVRESYLEHLLELDGVSREEAEGIARRRREHLEEELSAARSQEYAHRSSAFEGVWKDYVGGPESRAREAGTGVVKGRLKELLSSLNRFPEGFHLHPKLKRSMKSRKEMIEEKRPVDWSAGEALAFATLAVEGHRVRLTGQDSARGTFSHRHAVLHDYEDGRIHVPLQNLSPDQAPVEIYNSPLSELGVLGFEYGYSIGCPEGLVLWEAQFGDFANAAQVIIDQFIASAEDKWKRLSGIVLLLPHGFEGMGPEHSSARLERFLQLAAEDNFQVVNPTTPAQFFHCLRRQALRRWRKPLIVMTPKSLLRHPRVVSPLDDLAEGKFRKVLPDPAGINGPVKRILLCSGKIYYELEKKREEMKRKDVGIVRVEQLYPLPEEELKKTLAACADGTGAFWVQEEPENMGAWFYLRLRLGEKMFGRLPLSVISRPGSASPATGSSSSHKREQAQLLTEAFSGV